MAADDDGDRPKILATGISLPPASAAPVEVSMEETTMYGNKAGTTRLAHRSMAVRAALAAYSE